MLFVPINLVTLAVFVFCTASRELGLCFLHQGLLASPCLCLPDACVSASLGVSTGCVAFGDQDVGFAGMLWRGVCDECLAEQCVEPFDQLRVS